MSETTGSCLAVVEKKPQRAGGCVGIFFQLFDWNRRFAKKKLFSKKLLPPVRLKQSSKKFGGDDKHPKIRLIADENSGGFPIAKHNNGAIRSDVDQKHEMRVPGLVARLMGLESMPAQRDKSKKGPASGFVSGKAEKPVDNVSGSVREEMNVGKGRKKHELRPPKLQKTSVSDRQPIARFGPEKLPFKNVLSKSRQHCPKLPTPVKSPRSLSRKSSSKLIGAATRILEPGLHRSRSKCALTYSNILYHPRRNTATHDRTHSLPNQLEDSEGFANAAGKGQQCRNCGYLLDNLDSKPTVSEQPKIFVSPVSHCVGSSCQGSERSKPGHSAFCQELEEVPFDDYPELAATVMDKGQPHVKLSSYKSPLSEQIQQHSGSQQRNPLKAIYVSLSSNQKIQSENHMLHPRDAVPTSSKLNSLMSHKGSNATAVNGAKNFVSLNRSLSGGTRSRVPARCDKKKFDSDKRITNKLNDSVPPRRKRRPATISRHGESPGIMSSAIHNQNLGFPHAMPGKQLGYNIHLINHQCNGRGLIHLQKRTAGSGQIDNNVDLFTYESPVKLKIGSRDFSEEGKGITNDLGFADSLRQSATGENSGRKKLEKPVPLSGDALGAILDQKLKELTCQGEDIGGNKPKKATATILQELISALTSEMPFQLDNLPATSDGRNSWCNHSCLSNSSSSSSQANAMVGKHSVDQPLDSEHLSPGSVLEAYFSTESCPSSSHVDDCHGHQMLTESMDCSYYGLVSHNSDSEPLDSTAPKKWPKSSKALVIDILNNVSEILCCSNLSNCGLKGSKLDQAKEVLLNAELVFHNAAISGSAAGRALPIKHLLCDELETLTSVLRVNFGCSLGIEDRKEVNQCKTFVLDSIIEYLGFRFEGYLIAGSKGSRKLPLGMNPGALFFEVVEVVRRWEELSRVSLDELIEREMSHSLGEWTRCENEALQTGIEISRHLYQNLVDEIVADLWNCYLISSLTVKGSSPVIKLRTVVEIT